MRYELKYVVPDEALPDLRQAVAPFVGLDHHMHGYEDTGYTVRSIYFDTPRLTYYHDKLAGFKDRIKLRIRGYNRGGPAETVFLEIKRKTEATVRKNRAPMPYRLLDPLFATGRIDDYVRPTTRFPGAPEDARRFFFHLHRHALRPVCLVTYDREAYEGRFDPSLRITFDRNLRGLLYPGLPDLYHEDGLAPALPGRFILEVKFNTRFPAWMRPMIGQFHLQQQSASKYIHVMDLHARLPGMFSVLSLATQPGAETAAAPSRGDTTPRVPVPVASPSVPV